MCGRYTNTLTWKELVALYRLLDDAPREDNDGGDQPWTGVVNIAPTTRVPVIASRNGRRLIRLARWGLIPAWSKELPKFATHNAKAEEVSVKASFRDAWAAGRRCLVPATSFFEWKKLDEQARQPYAIGLGNKGPMALAGLWERWMPRAEPGQAPPQPMLTCTIITCAANALMAPVHHRMPVIVGEENLAAWLGEEPLTAQQAAAMLIPFPAERMSLWPVSQAVGQVKNQSPDLIEPVAA